MSSSDQNALMNNLHDKLLVVHFPLLKYEQVRQHPLQFLVPDNL